VPATGALNRGRPIATAAGLVFIAALQTLIVERSTRIGKVLWVADLTENGRAVPITYEGSSGRQNMAVMAGGGRPFARNVDESRIGGRLHVLERPTPNRPPAVDHGWQGTMWC
jgi:glucose dehydrogenase